MRSLYKDYQKGGLFFPQRFLKRAALDHPTVDNEGVAGKGLWLWLLAVATSIALQWHFNGTSTALKQHLDGTSAALQWQLNETSMEKTRQKTCLFVSVLLSALVEGVSVSGV